MSSSPLVFFGSGCAAPYHVFSNFFQTPIRLGLSTDARLRAALTLVQPRLNEFLAGRDYCFPSSEHLWQALQAYDLETFQGFTSSGRFGTWNPSIFHLTVAPKKAAAAARRRVKKQLPPVSRDTLQLDAAARSLAHWRAKDMIGIQAKLAANPDYVNVLDLEGAFDYGRERRLTPAVERGAWLAILRLKFEQNAALTILLRATGDALLVEFDRHAATKRGSYWGACLRKSDGVLCGQNMMGQYLTAARDAWVGE